MVSNATSKEPDYRIRPLLLRFADEAVEHRFNTEHLERGLPIIRGWLLAAAAVYALFGILDIYIVPEIKNVAWLVRYGVVCPLLIGLLVLTYSRSFPRVAQLALAGTTLVCGMGILVMCALAEAPGNSLYFAGLILVLVYSSSLLVRLHCANTIVVSLILIGLYEVVAIWLNPIPRMELLSNNFFLCSAAAASIFTSYVQEYYIRLGFVSTEMLRREKARSDELLTHAEAASKAKSDFLAVMSHELRTPLNAILGFSEIMQQRMFGPIGSERYIGYVDDIHGTAKHLLGIITDILDLSKAEVGRLTLNEEEVDIIDVLDQCFRLLREKAVEQGLRVSLQRPADRPLLRIDSRLVKQVFINLIGNAIKFTQPGGAITASVERQADGSCSAHIADTGIGIAPADIGRVLEPFVQVESAFNRKHGGTGLGLPLAKKIMELHGGTLSLESAPGIGTRVTIIFPASRAVRPAGNAFDAA